MNEALRTNLVAGAIGAAAVIVAYLLFGVLLGLPGVITWLLVIAVAVATIVAGVRWEQRTGADARRRVE